MGFKKDLKNGKQAEQYVVDLAKENGVEAKFSLDKCSEYDILLNDRVKIEVKFDIYSKKSGNIAIEFYNPKSGKPSGITISKADYWVYCFGDVENIFFISIQELLDLTKTKPIRIVESGGDGNASLMLYKLTSVMDKFRPLEELWNLL